MSGTHDLGDTVGAVALDASGRMPVAVSTGGIWLKTNGRVGDSPMVGAVCGRTQRAVLRAQRAPGNIS